MKVLFLSDDFPPKSFGGAGIITYLLAKGIVEAGHEVYVLTTVQDKEAPRGWREISGVRVFDLYNDYNGRFAAYVSLYNPSPLKALRALIEEVKPDVIHAHNIHNNISYHALKIARRYTDKVFLTTHDAMAFNYGKLIDFYNKDDLSVHTTFSYKVGFLANLKKARKRYNPVRNLMIRWYLNTFPKKIFAISNRLRDALQENGIKNVETIHCGIYVDPHPLRKDQARPFAEQLDLIGRKVVFFGGRLSEPKGGRVMIDALIYLVEKGTQVALLIAGTPNDYAKYLLQYAERHGVREHIVFTGWLSQEDMKKAYAVCDVVVTPSIYFDAFNLFNIEAGAAGRPVVGTCFGGTPEIILDKKTGIIVNPNNIPMLAEAIRSIISDRAFAERLGQAGYERVKQAFNIKRFVSDTLSWYQ